MKLSYHIINQEVLQGLVNLLLPKTDMRRLCLKSDRRVHVISG